MTSPHLAPTSPRGEVNDFAPRPPVYDRGEVGDVDSTHFKARPRPTPIGPKEAP